LLHKHHRKQLEELNWLQIEKKDSNPRMRLRRHKMSSITAINDLSLIAHKLPEDTVAEIFTYDRVKKLIGSVLSREDSPDHLDTVGSSDLNSRRTYLAALLVEEGIKICIEKYLAQNRETPILTEATVGQLNQAIKICNEIAYMVDLPMRREREDNLQYQFNWNRVPGPDEDKFVKFIEDIFGSIYENFKDDGVDTYITTKNESVFKVSLQEINEQYSASDKEFEAIAASKRASEIKLEILDPDSGIIAYFSLILRFSTKTVNLEYKRYRSKAIQLDTTNVVVKQDYGNFYIYKKQK
jgi:hypothetical protein